MDADTTPKTQEEVENLLRMALKNIEHAHLDELLAIEHELAQSVKKNDDTDSKIQALKEQLS